jgi:MarR family transcriptional regulator, transcriptional regulator for hemolysin
MAQTNSAQREEQQEEPQMGPSHELDAPPWLRVESTLMATATAIREAYDSRLAPLGLNLSTASLLAYLADFGPVNQTRVAEHLGQGRAVTGSQIDKLESLGLVERRPEPSDRRVWLVAITPGGTELAGAIADVDRVFRAELREGISRADRQTLAGLLVRLQDNIHRSNDTANNPANGTAVSHPDLRTPIAPARSAHTSHTPHSKGASS